MDPSSKNWFSVFQDEFQTSLEFNSLRFVNYLKHGVTERNFSHLYLHTSGLFYGHITGHEFCSYSNSDLWSETDHFKIAIVEGLYLAYFITQKKRFSRHPENGFYRKMIAECEQKIFDFYVLFSMHDSQSKKYRSFISKNKSTAETIEKIIDCRVSNPSLLNVEFWKGSLFNIFAGLDVVYFSLWLKSDYAYDRQEIIKNEILSLINQTCTLNDKQRKNAALINSYFQTSRSGDLFNLKENFYEKTFDFEDCRAHDSYLIRLFLFEYAAFTCFVDESLNLKEILFLQNLGKALKLKEDDIQESFVTIENYLIQEGEKIFYLQYGEGLETIKKAFLNRSQTFFSKNKSKILTEIMESKELVELLKKSVSENLSEEEKQKVRSQIFDLLKTIPSLAIFMIPGGTMILPLLWKILPEELLMPSSFLNKKN